jgi:hypothetical protein
LTYSSGDTNAYDRVWVYAVTITDAVARGFSRVTEGGYTVATGALGLSPALTGLVTTDKYVLTREHPDDLHEAIDIVLRHDYMDTQFPLSMHVVQNDANDMEASTVATDYELTTGNAAAALNTTTVHHGVQSMQLTANAANEYAALKAQIAVAENERLWAAVYCSVTQGDDAAFRIWNVQGAAEVDSATTDEPQWMNLQPPAFTVPASMEQLDLRLEQITSGDVAYWDDLQVWYDGGGIYPLPSFIEAPSQLLDVVAYPKGTQGPAGDNDFFPYEYAPHPIRWEWVSKDPGSMRIWASCGEARPYLQVLRARPELSAVTSTTTANSDWVVAMAEKVIREPEEAMMMLGAHKAAQLVRPETRPLPIGTVIR